MIDLSLTTDAVRAPELDDATGIGWRLADDARLVVRARSATITDAGRTLHLLLQPELPWVWKARHVALGLDLPPDTGFVWGGETAAPPARADDLWASVDHEIVWRAEAVGQGNIDREAVDAFARLENVDDQLALEAEFGATSLLADLRTLEPPPPSVDIRVMRLGTTVHHRLVGEGLEVRRERRMHDGTIEEIDCRVVPWTRVDRVRDGYQMITEASRDGVSVVVGRLHRSHVVEIETPEIRRVYFVPISGRVNHQSEEMWDAYVRESGLPPRSRMAIETRRPSLDEAAFAKPVSARLVSREVSAELFVPEGEEARDDLQAGTHLEATAADARRVDLPTAEREALDQLPDILVRPVGEALGRIAELVPHGPEVVHRERAVIDEVWRGAAEATISYTVEVGEQAWPPLPDGTRSPDFTVDAAGTLRRSIGDHGAAGGECDTCGRTLRSGESVCRSCAPITYLTAGEVAELPPALAATGCVIGRQNDVPSRPFTLIGPRRTERFNIVDGRVADWVTADKLGDEWLRLTIGLRRTLGLTGDISVGRLGSRGAELPGEAGVQLDFDERALAEFTIESLRPGDANGGDITGRTELTKSDPVRVLTAIAAALEIEDGPLPITANSADTQLLTHLRSLVLASAGAPDAAATLHIETIRVLERLWCDRAGLHRVTAHGEEVAISEVAWTIDPEAQTAQRVGVGEARAVARAELDSAKALVVHTTDGERIGVVLGDAPIRWYQTAEPLFLN